MSSIGQRILNQQQEKEDEDMKTASRTSPSAGPSQDHTTEPSPGYALANEKNERKAKSSRLPPLSLGLNGDQKTTHQGYETKSKRESQESEKDEDEDQYSFLSIFETKFGIDDSESTGQSAVPGCWDEVAETLTKLAPKCVQYDDGGIDIHFICRDYHENGVRSEDEVLDIFS